jgi:predicted ATPase/transcriptional regulator with XRE-family HTH domain
MEEQGLPVIFGEWLKRRRKTLDMTQDELAQRAGCSASALRKIETGERRPSKQLSALLAAALEIPPEDQQTFIRIARGELNLERLPQVSSKFHPRMPEILGLEQAQIRTTVDVGLTSTASLHRVPLQATPLIGREAEFAPLERLFRDPQCRLLTLTGIGGIGKTRLAIELADRMLPQFPGGVFYFPLTTVNSTEKIVPAIADVLDYVFSGPTNPESQLFGFISNNIKQEALFIFDNLEHLLAQDSTQDDQLGVAALVSMFLQRLPNIKILGTSRERLNLHGEWVYELHGLSVPPTDYTGRLEDYDSIALFVKRAQRIKADFEITVDDQLPLVRICQLVEGVPLAIELSAAWVGVLSCQEIAQEIQSNMDFLRTSMRDIPERHRSIRATFDHSWNLLSDEERHTLCQLAIFQGGFDRKAAYQITGASLNLLASLNAKSLLRRSENGRYDLHDVIRQYARSHLDEDPCKPETYEDHCAYYLAFVRDREKMLKSALQQEAMRQLTDEIDNIRAAWAWGIEHEKFAQLEEAGRAFGWYYEIAGLHQEGIEQLDQLTRTLRAWPHDPEWNRVLGLTLIHQALLYFRKGEFDRASEFYEESIILLRPTGDQELLADALIFLGILMHLTGYFERALELLNEGLVFARAAGDRWFEAYAIYNIGYIDGLLGRDEEGLEQMLAGLAIWRKLGDPHYIALGLNFLIPTL